MSGGSLNIELPYFWLGASADADPALVASDQAASRLAPAGVDPLRCEYVDAFTWTAALADIVREEGERTGHY